jgi:3'-5' exoribonuclease
MPARVYIADMTPNQMVEGVFTVQNCQLGLTKAGKPFIKCVLADRTGRTPGRMWNTTEELFNSLPTDGFVYLEGQTQPYQGEMQIIIQHIEAAKPRAEDLHDLLPSTKRNVDEMFSQVKRTLDSIKHPHLKALAAEYLGDKPLMAKFIAAPAAMALHHAYLGGLLEHTLNLLKLAEVVLPLYPKVSRDIVLMGLFLHDIGKCEELTWETGFGYTDDGNLIGHIARGSIWLEQKALACAARGAAIKGELLRVLQHIILSHHGLPEFGALKLPATPEAILVNMLDNIDAKMHMAIESARGDQAKPEELGGNFTEKVWALGNVRLYRPDHALEGSAEHDDEPADGKSFEVPKEADVVPLDPKEALRRLTQRGPGKGGI